MIDFDAIISRNVRKANETERLAHEPSGKLTASMLNWPLLEQVLKIIGVPVKQPDDYALRLFARGRQAEQFIIDHLDDVKFTQAEVEYRNCIGLVDVMLTDEIPIEVKSTKNSAFKWIEKEGKPKIGHALQATFYALALNKPLSRILYTAADDLRTLTFEQPTDALKAVVDKIIDEVEEQILSGELPSFTTREDWQATGKYSNYPDWIVLEPEDAMKKLEQQFPDAFKRLKGEIYATV